MVATSPRPIDEDLGKFYESTEYISHTSKANNLVHTLYLIARSFTLKQKRKLAQQLVPQKGKILDVGCGTGDFLQSGLHDNGNCTGVEPGKQPMESAASKGI